MSPEAFSTPITEKQYNYLVPVPAMCQKLSRRFDERRGFVYYAFIGDHEELRDMYARLRYLD